MQDRSSGGEPGIAGLAPGQIATVARPTLGPDAAVAAFRAVRLGALGSMAGAGLNGAVYLAGRRWAQSLAFAAPADVFRTMVDLRLGLPRLVQQSSDTIEIALAESLSGAGVTPGGVMLCHFAPGLLAALPVN